MDEKLAVLIAAKYSDQSWQSDENVNELTKANCGNPNQIVALVKSYYQYNTNFDIQDKFQQLLHQSQEEENINITHVHQPGNAHKIATIPPVLDFVIVPARQQSLGEQQMELLRNE